MTLPVDPVMSSDPTSLRHPAGAAPLRQAGEALCGSSSPTDPALLGRSAWEKLYAPKAQRHKGFRQTSFTYFEFRRVLHNGIALLHSAGSALHRTSARLWRAPQPRIVSSAAAISSSRRSAPKGATTWTPTGSPSVVSPAGTEIAGHPVTVIT